VTLVLEKNRRSFKDFIGKTIVHVSHELNTIVNNTTGFYYWMENNTIDKPEVVLKLQDYKESGYRSIYFFA
jgi:hypothetical protein